MQQTVNQRINFIFIESGIGKSEFANRINKSRSSLDELLFGQREPRSGTVRDICKAFGVSEIWLRTGAGEPYVNGSLQLNEAAKQSDAVAFLKTELDRKDTVIQNLSEQIDRLTLLLSKAMGVELGKADPLGLLASVGEIIPMPVLGAAAA